MGYKEGQVIFKCPKCCSIKPERAHHCSVSIYVSQQNLIIEHTPPERLPGSVQCPRPMTFTQLFFGISGTQNRKNQNFLTSPFFVIAILRYPTFPYCFYYIAILEPSDF